MENCPLGYKPGLRRALFLSCLGLCECRDIRVVHMRRGWTVFYEPMKVEATCVG